MDLEDIEIKHPKCFLVVISFGIIIELYVLLSF